MSSTKDTITETKEIDGVTVEMVFRRGKPSAEQVAAYKEFWRLFFEKHAPKVLAGLQNTPPPIQPLT